MMRTIIFVFISVILESRGYGKIIGDCSPQVDMPCTLHKLTGDDCSPVNLRTEFPFFETNTAKFPGKPGSFDAVGSYRYYPTYNRWFPEVNLTFTTPQNTGKNYVKGFEVTRYDASNNNRPTCYILDLSNVTWDENSVADMHTKFRLDLYPLNPADPRYFTFEVYALPKQENRDVRFDQYLQKFIQFPGYIPVNDRSPRNWLAMIYYTQDSNLGTINVTIEQPPAEYNFTLFEYSLVHSGSNVPFILEKSKKTWYQFTKVPTGVYQIWVTPVKDDDHCPCKDVTGLVCDICWSTVTKNFSFNYTGPPFPRTTSRQVEIVNPVNTITTTGLTSKTSGGGTTTESMERLSTQSPEVSKAQVAMAAVVSPSIATPSPTSCSFDSGLCNWKQDHTDTFDWTRQNGSTLSVNTGPEGDHSGAGYYVYIETTGGSLGDKARLISPEISPDQQGQSCFTFWYNMYGRNINRLNVYVQSGPSLLTSLIWYKKGTQGNQWMEGNITIKAAEPFRIILEGIRGGSFRGDIAVDDVELSEGPCGSQLTGVPTTSISVSKSTDKAILGNNTFAFSCDYIVPLQAHLFAVELQRRRKDDSNFITIVTFQNQSNQINVTYQDTSLESRTERIKPTTENNSTAGLEFRNIECSDKAEYKCKVFYSDGTNTSIENTIKVVVKAQTMVSEKGRITFFPNTNITEGDEVVFNCERDVGSEPEGDIAWFYYLNNDTTNAVDATSDASSTAPVYQENTCTYTRTSMLRLNMTEDFNNVTVRCTAQQNVLNQSGDGYVQTNKIPVQLFYSPTIDLIANKTYTAGQGALTLRCTADSNPAPDYVWLLPDGSESIGSHLELTNLTVGNSGFYMCIAHNVFKGENHTTNTTIYIRVEKAPTPSTEVTTTTPSSIQTTSGEAYYSLKGAIHVECTNYHWNITVELDKIRHIYPTARASDIYLGENKCKGVQNGDLLVFQHDLSECLTSELLVNGIEVYNNELIYAEHDPVYLFIVLHYNWTVGVECDIGQNGTAIGGFPSNATSAIAHNISSPQYPVSVSFYKDQDFIQEIGKGNPLHAQIGSHVYAKVFTTVTDWNIRMRVHTCYTKPTEQVHDHMKYFLIKDGCEVNTNTHIISQSTHETRFVFDSFEYSNSHDGIYVFCDALFCDSSDWSAQCRQTCNPVT